MTREPPALHVKTLGAVRGLPTSTSTPRGRGVRPKADIVLDAREVA